METERAILNSLALALPSARHTILQSGLDVGSTRIVVARRPFRARVERWRAAIGLQYVTKSGDVQLVAGARLANSGRTQSVVDVE